MHTIDGRGAVYRGPGRISVEPIGSVPPAGDDVQVRVAFAGICGSDLHLYHGHLDGRVKGGLVPGHEMSGVITAIGPDVERASVGERVVVRPILSCGACRQCMSGRANTCPKIKVLGIDVPGALQTFWTVPEENIHVLPEDLPLDVAALVEPLAVAVHDLASSRVSPESVVLVIGGGPIGTLIALLASDLGAQVVLSEQRDHRRLLAIDLGLNALLPTDARDHVLTTTHGTGADVVFDAAGTEAAVNEAVSLVGGGGQVVVVGIHTGRPSIDLMQVFLKEINIQGVRLYDPSDFDEAIAIASRLQATLARLVTSVRPLDEVGMAFADLAAGGNAMKYLIAVDGA